MCLRIERSGTTVSADRPARDADRRHFARHHWVRIEGFVAPRLLAAVRRGLATATFTEVRHEAVTPPSIDVCMEPNTTSAMLELLCNDRRLLDAVADLTGSGPLSRFSGFVYRLGPDAGHHHNWHNDVMQARRIAMSINLEEPYEGGVLHIRERDTGEILARVENTGPGDAVLFRIDQALQHRVTPVTRGTKTAFAGWFRSADPLREALVRASLERSAAS